MAPASIAFQQRQRGPKSQTRSDGKSIVIKRRELIGTVNGGTSFTATKYAVNPGIASTFPLLSVQAPQWEQYRFRKLAFEYITRTATTTLGSVILAADYDASDVTPVTEAQLTGYEGAVEDAPWKNITCFIDCSAVSPGPRKFIRNGAVPADIKNYDACNFFLGVTEMASTLPVGKLWVDYEVELSIPQNSPDENLYSKSVSYYTRSASLVGVTTVNTKIDFDPPAAGADPLGIGIDLNGDFVPPRGVYRLDFNGTFRDLAAESFTAFVSFFKNGALIGPQSNFNNFGSAGTEFQLSHSWVIPCNGTDVINVMMNLTGAAGSLNLEGSTSALLWSVV